MNTDPFITAYLECALWASTDEYSEPLDKNYTIFDFAPEAIQKIIEDCDNFRALLSELEIESPGSSSQNGHDFFLTRNGHGTGFWDRGYDNGDELSKWAKSFGNQDLYVGDGGKLYV